MYSAVYITTVSLGLNDHLESFIDKIFRSSFKTFSCKIGCFPMQATRNMVKSC